MKRPRQHIMETESEQLLGQLIPSSWVTRSVAKDYGVDFEIELVDNNTVSGKRIWIQLKAVERIKIRTQKYKSSIEEAKDVLPENKKDIEVEYLPFSMEVDNLKYCLSCTFPVLLFLANLESKEIYWLPI